MSNDFNRKPTNEPSLPSKAWSITKALASFVFDGMQTVSREQYQERIKICDQCEHRTANRCRKCGCSLGLKASGRAFHCPLKKWPGDQENEPNDEMN